VKEWLKNQILDHQEYAFTNGIDQPEIRDWKWPGHS
jgi:xylulose-5-phosphate/fructose-6-phosphate phosphoketolase